MTEQTPNLNQPQKNLKAGGKQYKDLVRDFKNNGRLSRLLEAEDFSDRGLIEVNTKTNKHFVGWMHPRAALVIAICWFEPSIASEVIGWYYRFLSGDASLVHDVADRVDLVHGTKSLLTHTVADKDDRDDELAEVHAQAARYQADLFRLQSQLRDALSKQTESSQEADRLTADAALLRTQLRDALSKQTASAQEVERLALAHAQLQSQLRDTTDALTSDVDRLTADLARLGTESVLLQGQLRDTTDTHTPRTLARSQVPPSGSKASCVTRQPKRRWRLRAHKRSLVKWLNWPRSSRGSDQTRARCPNG